MTFRTGVDLKPLTRWESLRGERDRRGRRLLQPICAVARSVRPFYAGFVGILRFIRATDTRTLSPVTWRTGKSSKVRALMTSFLRCLALRSTKMPVRLTTTQFTPLATSQRANQNPSRPALWTAWTAASSGNMNRFMSLPILVRASRCPAQVRRGRS